MKPVLGSAKLRLANSYAVEKGWSRRRLHGPVRATATVLLSFTVTLALVSAQGQPKSPQFDVIYSCSSGTKLKVLSCVGSSDNDSCEIQYLDPTAPDGLGARISVRRKQVTELLQTCVIYRPPAPRPPAQQALTPPISVPPAVRPAAPAASGQNQPPLNVPRPSIPAPAQQAGMGGFKVGDTVRVLTGAGWVDGKVLGIRGNSFFVRVGSVEVTKQYPFEVRRNGPLTAEDHAFGLYDLHDRVQVLFENRWVESEVISMQQFGYQAEYQVTLPGNRTGWAKPEQMRYIGPQVKAAPPKAGTPPKPGLTSCAGKIEGRYSSSSVGLGVTLTIVFRSGKATMSDLGGSSQFECWMGGGKIYLHNPGDPNDFELDINNDGTLDSPFGELKKKGN